MGALFFAVLDGRAQTDAVNIGLAGAAGVIAALVVHGATKVRNRRRQDRARAAAIEANRERASYRAAARGKAPADAEIIARLDGEAR